VSRPARLALVAAGTLLFGVLATANSGGYRYGVSDQAFYVPAAVLAMDAEAFPKDAPLVASQARLLVADEIIGVASSITGLRLPALFLAGYVVTLAALAVAGASLGRALGLSGWGTAALLLLMTFRHRIARTGANSLEGYMHPRMLAFAVGTGALAALVRGRPGWALVGVAVAAGVHPTTAFWFGIVVAVGIVVARPAWRRPLLAVGAALLLAGLWVVLAGPLAGRLAPMDPAWLTVLAGKDYLFPTDWPIYAWVLNLLYPAVIVASYRYRAARGLAVPGEGALVAGLLALVVVFLLSVPFTALRIALAVELQVTRVFWILDIVAVAYLAWWLTRPPAARTASWRPAVVVAVLLAASAGRGIFLLTVEAPERRLVAVDLAESPWHDAMGWLRSQPADWHVLADPGHAWKHGTSVRVGARRDTLVESTKDSAIAMYDRDVAMRVADRLAAVGAWDSLDAAAFRRLDARYDLDVAVADAGHVIDLPVLYRNRQFVIYDLR
jgi:hypothetical protein